VDEVSLLEAMRAYAKLGRRRLHTPGHKGRLDWKNPIMLDITELGVDGKIFPSDLIQQAERKTAEYFGSYEARLLVGGSSMGIKASIMTVDGDCIVGEDSHRAVFEGLELTRRKAITVPNIVNDGLALPLTAEQIEQAAKTNPNAKAVIITSPTYFGIAVSNPKKLVEAAHHYGLKEIANRAHGTHFPASDVFPKSFSTIADYSVLSGHKTLDTLTQGAYLCINDTSNICTLDHNLKLLGTTSPSYLILASLEYGIEQAQRANVDNVLKNIEEFKRDFIQYYNPDNHCALFTAHPSLIRDPFRLVVDARLLNMTGHQLEASERNRGIECELANERYVVYIFTFADAVYNNVFRKKVL